jgi:hypothetical protein
LILLHFGQSHSSNIILFFGPDFLFRAFVDDVEVVGCCGGVVVVATAGIEAGGRSWGAPISGGALAMMGAMSVGMVELMGCSFGVTSGIEAGSVAGIWSTSSSSPSSILYWIIICFYYYCKYGQRFLYL